MQDSNLLINLQHRQVGGMRDQRALSEELSEKLRRNNDYLRVTKRALNDQKLTLEQLAAELPLNGENMIALGDGYFASMSSEESRAFFVRKIEKIASAIKEVDAKFAIGENSLEKLNAINGTSEHGEVNEDGLPYVEILEELDAENNVVSAKVSPQGKPDVSPTNPAVNFGSHEMSDKKDTQQLRTIYDKGILSNDTELADGVPELQNEWHELMSDMGIMNEDDDGKGGVKGQHLLGPTSANTAKEITNQVEIDEDEIIKLELFDELDDEDMNVPDDVEWDYDFEDDDERESDDDSLADQMLYGERGTTLLPRNNKKNIEGLLWDHISHLRQNNEKKLGVAGKRLDADASEVAESVPKKSVRFSESLDIKSIENVGEQLKNITYTDRKLSKFKQNRISNDTKSFGNRSQKLSPLDLAPISNEPVHDVVERDVPIVAQKVDSGNQFTRKSEGHSPITSSDGYNTSSLASKIPEVLGVTSDPASYTIIDNDLDAMVKAYNDGFGQENNGDMVVVNELADFEKLNAALNQALGENSLGDPMAITSHFSLDDYDTDSEDGPVLRDEIVENEDDLNAGDIDSLMHQEQINHEYQTLSRKFRSLKHTNNEERELEPLNEEKQPVKVSRFKANRLKRS